MAVGEKEPFVFFGHRLAGPGVATSGEWLLCDICSPFCRAIGASGLAGRWARVLVRARAAGSLRSGCVTGALYLNFLRLGSGTPETELLIQTLQKSKVL